MKPDDFKRLVASGMTTDQIAIVMEMMERDARSYAEAEEARKAKGRERIQRWREARNVTETQPKVTVPLTGGDARVEDKTSNSEIEPLKEERNALTREFAQTFWPEYPNKVGKPKAEAAFRSARKRASLETIMAGLARYVASKPHDRAWMNPATFLNQERWADQPAEVTPQARGSPFGGERIPQLADVFKIVARQANDEKRDDSEGLRPAIPHLSAVRSR